MYTYHMYINICMYVALQVLCSPSTNSTVEAGQLVGGAGGQAAAGSLISSGASTRYLKYQDYVKYQDYDGGEHQERWSSQVCARM